MLVGKCLLNNQTLIPNCQTHEVAHKELSVDDKEFLLGYGKSTWMKQERIMKMERENATGG